MTVNVCGDVDPDTAVTVIRSPVTLMSKGTFVVVQRSPELLVVTEMLVAVDDTVVVSVDDPESNVAVGAGCVLDDAGTMTAKGA